jgi:hypothetical protein
VARRRAAVAGLFYPNEEGQLREELEGYLAAAERERPAAPGEAPPRALIAPHAGTVYSGPVAATAYARLAPLRETIRRVLLLGPSHRAPLQGLGTPSHDAFETPLGDVTIDRESLSQLEQLPQVSVNDEAHRREHSLEVHLPFLQLVLGDFALVPLVVGRARPEEVAEVIAALWEGPETMLVVSSDLSHYHDYETAKALDLETSELIQQLAHEKINDERACGAYPIRGLLQLARNREMRVRAIDLRNSGDTAGPRREVVGYGSYVVH